jgi:HPt (histidine-containing phosphotransfer) domain-containing protein
MRTDFPSDRCLRIEVLEEACAGMSDVIAEVLESFLAEAPTDIDRIFTALESGDLTAARRAAHGLKGACLTVGAESLASACGRIEALPEGAAVPNPAATNDALAGEWELLRSAIESRRQLLTIDPTAR